MKLLVMISTLKIGPLEIWIFLLLVCRIDYAALSSSLLILLFNLSRSLRRRILRGIFWRLCHTRGRLGFHRRKVQQFCVCSCGLSGRSISFLLCARLHPCILRMNSLYWRIFYCGSSVHALRCGGWPFDYRGRYG